MLGGWTTCGWNEGDWRGRGIASSAAAKDAAGATAVGVANVDGDVCAGADTSNGSLPEQAVLELPLLSVNRR